MFWHVLSKSGLRTGLAILVIGLVPVFCFSGWGAYSLGADMRSLLPFSLPLDEGALSLLPNVFDDRKFNCSDLIRGVDDRKRPRQRRAKIAFEEASRNLADFVAEYHARVIEPRTPHQTEPPTSPLLFPTD